MKRSRDELEARLQEIREANDAARGVVYPKRPVAQLNAPLPSVPLPPVVRHAFVYVPPTMREMTCANDARPASNVVRVAFGRNPRLAYDLYAKASTLDEDAVHLEEAEAMYRRAIALDPTLAIAYTNLGNIRFHRSDEREAEALYRQALEIDPRQPEGHYNLGYVLAERGDVRAAIPELERAVELSPRFADAIFNLATAYETVRERGAARRLWKRYLELEPTGAWAEIAVQYLRGEVGGRRR